MHGQEADAQTPACVAAGREKVDAAMNPGCASYRRMCWNEAVLTWIFWRLNHFLSAHETFFPDPVCRI